MTFGTAMTASKRKTRKRDVDRLDQTTTKPEIISLASLTWTDQNRTQKKLAVDSQPQIKAVGSNRNKRNNNQ